MESNTEIECQIDITLESENREECPDCLAVHILPEVEAFIREVALVDAQNELGGVLLGDMKAKDGYAEVTVEAALEAVYTQASPMSLTFTHATWEEINRVKDERYPHLKIVGWFHSHPGLGVFMSPMDEFIHHNFFDLPWQIAYVVDPLQDQCGMFMWDNDRLVEVRR